VCATHTKYWFQWTRISLGIPLLHTQVEQAIFGLSNDDEYVVTATNDKEDIKKLIQSAHARAGKMSYCSSENANKQDRPQS
jgi:hypothetical protein